MKVPFLEISQPEGLTNVFRQSLLESDFILGKHVSAFEKEFASYVGTDWCTGTGNGYDALFIALKALGIQPGDEVIVSSNAYIACWLAITNLGAVPVPVEPSVLTMNIDESLIESRITPQTKAIMAVHLYGLSCDMYKLMQLASKHDLYVVEDYAQAHGAKFNDQLCGSFGHLNATSFYPTKNLGALGDGGAITGNDETLVQQCRLMGNYGSSTKNVHEIIGVNSRLDEIQAAFLRVKLKMLDEENTKRRKIAARYLERLAAAGLVLPHSPEHHFHVYHQFVIRTEHRDALKAFLEKQGVHSAIHYPKPPHLQEVYHFMDFSEGDFPIAEKMAATALSLPLYPSLSAVRQEHVIDSILTFCKNNF